MAKLDDFGRPIYETAEEYNKAHKGGVCPRPYDSPEGENYQHNTGNATKSYKTVAQKHATVQGSKKAMKTVIAIVIAILSLNIGVIFSLLGNVVDEEFIQQGEMVQTEEVIQNYDEFLSDASTPLPVGYEMFYYDGEFYKLPMKCEDVAQMGFVTDAYSLDESIPSGYGEIITLYDEENGMQVEVRFSNNTEDDIQFAKCTVDFFLIENPTIYDVYADIPDFFFGTAELSFESSYEEIEEYLGDPHWHYHEGTDEYTYDIYQWMYYPDGENTSEEYIQFVEVKFFDGMIESVSIEKAEYEEKY